MLGDSWARNVPHFTNSRNPPPLPLLDPETEPLPPLAAALAPGGILPFSSGLEGGVTAFRAGPPPALAVRRASNKTDEEVTPPSQLARPPLTRPRRSSVDCAVETDRLRRDNFFGGWNSVPPPPLLSEIGRAALEAAAAAAAAAFRFLRLTARRLRLAAEAAARLRNRSSSSALRNR